VRFLSDAIRTRARKVCAFLAVTATLCVMAIVAANYPWDVDAPLSGKELEESREYYAEAYQQTAPERQPASEYETKYLQVATSAAASEHIEERVRSFADQYGLRQKPVLDVGSGRGYLQDIVEDYTGLDIAPSVRRFYHKKFVLASATAMPFADDTFDGLWSIWVLEHVPNPEQALRECRRVTRDGGVMLLLPAWNCTSWAADGYEVRPYSDFGFAGKIIKATIPVRSSHRFRILTRLSDRLIRYVASCFGGPTTLHYQRLTPNFKEYWQPDSDAVNSVDRHEVMLWFQSRGDECLNCDGAEGSVLMRRQPALIIRVHKDRRATPATSTASIR